MSEFDLIDGPALKAEGELGVQIRHLSGPANIAVLEIGLGKQDFKERPGPAEIPGLNELSEVGVSEIEWTGSGLSQGGHCFLSSLGPPVRVEVSLQDLPGLEARAGDQLPPDFEVAIQWDWSLPEQTHLYALGQRSMPLERRGTAPVNWTTDEPSGHLRSTDPLYQAHPLLWGVTEKTWWAALCLHTPYSKFDLGQSKAERMRWLTLGPGLTVQIHTGSSPNQLLRSLQQTIQRVQPPPLWALGFHQSRWGYASADEVRELLETFRSKALPLDVVHLDIDHMQDYRSFSFHQDNFPDPAQLMSDFKTSGARTVALIDPGLRFDPGNDYVPVDEALAENHVIKSVSGAPLVGYCWPDEAVFPDFLKQKTRHWWAEKAHFYLDHGVSGLWIDMNEPAIFDKPFWSGGAKPHPMPLATPAGESGRKLNHTAFRNIYASQMAKATDRAWAKRQRRPWVLTRAGFTGVGRYAWSWMGDNTSWWEHLALSLPQLCSMGLVGSPFVGVDIGGFFGECTGELYSAWMEAAVIYPFMRSHSAMGTRQQHPWSFGPEVEQVARTALNLRYRLMPYIYGAAMAQSEGAPPLLRPLFFDYPGDQRFRTLEDQAMFGPHLMAAPFLRRGIQERAVFLPDGDWYDLHTAEFHRGSSTLLIRRRPGLVPLFARAGAVIPRLQEEAAAQCTDLLHSLPWELCCLPGSSDLVSTVYWDHGDGHEHTQGAHWRRDLRLRERELEIVKRSGDSDFPAPTLRLCWPSSQGWVRESEPTDLR